MEAFDTGILCRRGGREANEDRAEHHLLGASGCWIVADGLGGHRGGEAASEITVRSILGMFRTHSACRVETLHRGFEAAQAELLRRQAAKSDLFGMRSTAVALLSGPSGVLWGHVGDSRLYWFRGGRKIFQTTDHSLSQALRHAGRSTSGPRIHGEGRHQLTRSLGQEGGSRPEFVDAVHPVLEGDALLLCSDGFWELVDSYEMEIDLAKSHSASEWVERLEERLSTRLKNKADNYSAIGIICKVTLGRPGTVPIPKEGAPEPKRGSLRVGGANVGRVSENLNRQGSKGLLAILAMLILAICVGVVGLTTLGADRGFLSKYLSLVEGEASSQGTSSHASNTEVEVDLGPKDDFLSLGLDDTPKRGGNGSADQEISGGLRQSLSPDLRDGEPRTPTTGPPPEERNKALQAIDSPPSKPGSSRSNQRASGSEESPAERKRDTLSVHEIPEPVTESTTAALPRSSAGRAEESGLSRKEARETKSTPTEAANSSGVEPGPKDGMQPLPGMTAGESSGPGNDPPTAELARPGVEFEQVPRVSTPESSDASAKSREGPRPGEVRAHPNPGAGQYVWIPPVPGRQGFWIGQTEVSWGSYERYVDRYLRQKSTRPRGYTENLPATGVTWGKAQDYCERWIGGSLPNADQWGAAAEGGQYRPQYPWGDTSPECQKSAPNGAAFQECPGKEGQPWPIDSFQPSRNYRLHHIVGNVAEWGKALHESDTAPIFGGSWKSSREELRITTSKEDRRKKKEAHWIGFRCVLKAFPGN